jgi:hypothetical protein
MSAEGAGVTQLLGDRRGEEKAKGVLEIASDRQRQGRSNNKVISGEGVDRFSYLPFTLFWQQQDGLGED